MKPHKHAEVIKAWADGAEIEYRRPGEIWKTSGPVGPAWNPDSEYRVKPKPPQTLQFLLSKNHFHDLRVMTVCGKGEPSELSPNGAVLTLEIEPDTWTLVSAKLEKP
jgi:hypothetical protein